MTNIDDSVRPLSEGHCFGGGYDRVIGIASSIFTKKPPGTGWVDACAAMGGTREIHQGSWDDKTILSISEPNGFSFFLPAESRLLDDFFATRALAHHLLHSNRGYRSFFVNDRSIVTLESIWFSLALLAPDRLFLTLSEAAAATDENIAAAIGTPKGIIALKRKILAAVARERDSNVVSIV